MIVPFILRANSWAKSDLPDAVGPVIIYAFAVICTDYSQDVPNVNKIL